MGSVFKLLMFSAAALFASLSFLFNYSSSLVYNAKPISVPDEQQPLASNDKPNSLPNEQQPLAKQRRELSVEQWNASVRETMARDARAERERKAQEIRDKNLTAYREPTSNPRIYSSVSSYRETVPNNRAPTEAQLARQRQQQIDAAQASRRSFEIRTIQKTMQSGEDYYRRQLEQPQRTKESAKMWNRALSGQIETRDRKIRNVR